MSGEDPCFAAFHGGFALLLAALNSNSRWWCSRSMAKTILNAEMERAIPSAAITARLHRMLELWRMARLRRECLSQEFFYTINYLVRAEWFADVFISSLGKRRSP